MGLFNKLFKSSEDLSNTLFSPLSGKSVSLSYVNDPTFSEEILGKGVAILPTSTTVLSPCDGTVDLMFDTGHAVNLISDSGIEILIHIGLETVALKGKHFKTLKNTGDKVKKGDALIEFDLDGLKNDGYDTIVPIVICNSDSYKEITPIISDVVNAGDKILSLSK